MGGERSEGLIPLRHVVAFRSVAQAFSLDDERVEDSERKFVNGVGVTFTPLPKRPSSGEYE